MNVERRLLSSRPGPLFLQCHGNEISRATDTSNWTSCTELGVDMAFVIHDDFPRIRNIRRASALMTPHKMTIFGRDSDENIIQVQFTPFQAIKITTIDCFEFPSDWPLPPPNLGELMQSAWIAELSAKLRRIDVGADFLNKSKHFIMPAQDAIIEIIAWGYSLRKMPGPNALD